MPRLNYGTLLENLIVLEVMRLCFDHSAPEEATAFASSFAMPPLTECWCKSENERNNSPNFDHDFLRHLTGRQNPEQSLKELWSLCVINQPDLPICEYRAAQPDNMRYDAGGPNGALLGAMLDAQLGRTIHLWLNDNGGRYGLIPPRVLSAHSELPATLVRGGALVGMPIEGTTAVHPGVFPDAIAGLRAWLAEGNAHFGTRVGFLDPDNYAQGQGAEVSPYDHRLWLRTLATDCEQVLSAMFFACQNRGRDNVERNRLIARFHNDELGMYPQSLVFEYGILQTGVKIRWPANQITELVADLSDRVQEAWHDWCPRLKDLTIHVNGHPG
ncbi:MAG: hypothetical protein V1792_29360 [Pseudomonadota bacterium]